LSLTVVGTFVLIRFCDLGPTLPRCRRWSLFLRSRQVTVGHHRYEGDRCANAPGVSGRTVVTARNGGVAAARPIV